MSDIPLFEIGKSLLLVGFILGVIGLTLILTAKVPWIGRLPGDIQYTKGSFTFYFPLVTCVLISGLVSLVLWLFRR